MIFPSATRARTILIAVAALLLAPSVNASPLPPRSAASPRSTAMKQHHLTEAIAAVKTGHTAMERTNAANHLAQLTHKIDPQAVDDATLNALIALLDSPEESVRAGVAGAIGNLGPRAKSAAPKLVSILPDDSLVVGLSSSGAIRLALQRIGAPAPSPGQH